MKKQPKKSIKQLMQQYGVCRRTLERWRKKGVDIQDPKAVASLIAAQKNVPQALAGGMQKKHGTKPTTPTDPIIDEAELSRTGAPAAWARVCDIEVSLAKRVKRLIGEAEPDPMELKASLVDYQRVLNALSQLFARLSSSQRAEQFWIERPTIEKHLQMLSTFWHFSVLECATALSAADPGRREEIAAQFDGGFCQALSGLASQGDIPGWMIRSLRQAQDANYRHSKATVTALAEDFASWLKTGRPATVAGDVRIKGELSRLVRIIREDREAMLAAGSINRGPDRIQAEDLILAWDKELNQQ